MIESTKSAAPLYNSIIDELKELPKDLRHQEKGWFSALPWVTAQALKTAPFRQLAIAEMRAVLDSSKTPVSCPNCAALTTFRLVPFEYSDLPGEQMLRVTASCEKHNSQVGADVAVEDLFDFLAGHARMGTLDKRCAEAADASRLGRVWSERSPLIYELAHGPDVRPTDRVHVVTSAGVMTKQHIRDGDDLGPLWRGLPSQRISQSDYAEWIK
jgi:hypothetical protein